MDQDNLETVSQEMMDELELAGEVSQPIDLDDIINDAHYLVDTPLIENWYHSKKYKVSAQKSSLSICG